MKQHDVDAAQHQERELQAEVEACIGIGRPGGKEQRSGDGGSILHAIAEEGVPTRDIAEVIGRHLDLPVEAAEREHFGWLGGFFGADIRASSALTRELVGWQPTHPGLIEDLDQGHYFEG